MDKSMRSLPQHIINKSLARRSSTFDFRAGSDVCPTCSGTGKVPKGQQEELVALIPYGDKRLKPRRTCLIIVVFILIIVVMVIAATLLAVFLSPRDVTLSVTEVLASNWSGTRPPNTTEGNAYMVLKVHAMAKNYNYASIKIKDINITVSRHELMVGHAVHQQITVNARQHKEVVIIVNATYGAESTKAVVSDMERSFIGLYASIFLPIFVPHKQHR